MRISDRSSDVCSSDLAAQEKGWFFGGAASGALVAGGSTSGSNAGRAFPSFGTRPVVILFLQRKVPQAPPVLSCMPLHRAEAALELGVRTPQRPANIDFRVPRPVGTDEQEVAQCVPHPPTDPHSILYRKGESNNEQYGGP